MNIYITINTCHLKDHYDILTPDEYLMFNYLNEVVI